MKKTVLLLLCALTSVVANAELWTSFKLLLSDKKSKSRFWLCNLL